LEKEKRKWRQKSSTTSDIPESIDSMMDCIT
jgi:hypothetical protein